jgi:hypothetical protein
MKERIAAGEHGVDLVPRQTGQSKGHNDCSPEYERARLLH